MTHSSKHLVRKLSYADYTTFLAVVTIAVAFWLLWNKQLYLAVGFAFLSTFLDFCDGMVARKYGGSPYGKMFDSLYDVLGWVLFPALVINIQSGWQWWSIVITTLYCVAAVMRLGRFTEDGYIEESAGNYYQGLPVLYSKYALLIAFFWQAIPAVLILAVMIPLMISSRLVPKQQSWLAWLEIVYAAVFMALGLGILRI